MKSTSPEVATNSDDTVEISVVGRLFGPTFQMLTVILGTARDRGQQECDLVYRIISGGQRKYLAKKRVTTVGIGADRTVPGPRPLIAIIHGKFLAQTEKPIGVSPSVGENHLIADLDWLIGNGHWRRFANGRTGTKAWSTRWPSALT